MIWNYALTNKKKKHLISHDKERFKKIWKEYHRTTTYGLSSRASSATMRCQWKILKNWVIPWEFGWFMIFAKMMMTSSFGKKILYKFCND